MLLMKSSIITVLEKRYLNIKFLKCKALGNAKNMALKSLNLGKQY